MIIYAVARKYVNRGRVEVDKKIKPKVSDWLEVKTDLGKIPYRVVKINGEKKKDSPPIGKANKKITSTNWQKVEEKEEKALAEFKKKADKFDLDMKPVAALITNDDDRLIFYFTAPSRIDFRRLVKDLASTFHKLIRLQQINSRTAAMIQGGVGPCGRKICCRKGVIKEITEVPSELIEEQMIQGIDSSKLSGACGKLACCLKYEIETYRQLSENMPQVGDKISLKGQKKKAKVVDVNPLSKSILVELADGSRKEISIK